MDWSHVASHERRTTNACRGTRIQLARGSSMLSRPSMLTTSVRRFAWPLASSSASTHPIQKLVRTWPRSNLVRSGVCVSMLSSLAPWNSPLLHATCPTIRSRAKPIRPERVLVCFRIIVAACRCARTQPISLARRGAFVTQDAQTYVRWCCSDDANSSSRSPISITNVVYSPSGPKSSSSLAPRWQLRAAFVDPAPTWTRLLFLRSTYE